MRLTEQDKNTLKETHDKWLNEAGWLAKLFIKRFQKILKKIKLYKMLLQTQISLLNNQKIKYQIYLMVIKKK